MLRTSTITQKGQVTIPVLIRRELSLEPGEKVAFELEEETARLYKAPDFFDFRGFIRSGKPFDIKMMRKAVRKEAVKRYVKTS